MPNSLRVKLSKLRYKGEITQEEYAELIEKLDGHDKELLDKVAEKLKAKYPPYFNEFGMNVNDTLQKDIDEVIEELKAEEVR